MIKVTTNKNLKYNYKANIFYVQGSKAFSILNGVNRLLISLDRTEYTVNNRVMQQKCESVLTGILGTPIQSDKTYDLQIQS